jgi:hypothetical protein
MAFSRPTMRGEMMGILPVYFGCPCCMEQVAHKINMGCSFEGIGKLLLTFVQVKVSAAGASIRGCMSRRGHCPNVDQVAQPRLIWAATEYVSSCSHTTLKRPYYDSALKPYYKAMFDNGLTWRIYSSCNSFLTTLV